MDEDTTDAAWAQQEQEQREALERGNRALAELRVMNREFAQLFNLPIRGPIGESHGNHSEG